MIGSLPVTVSGPAGGEPEPCGGEGEPVAGGLAPPEVDDGTVVVVVDGTVVVVVVVVDGTVVVVVVVVDGTVVVVAVDPPANATGVET